MYIIYYTPLYTAKYLYTLHCINIQHCIYLLSHYTILIPYTLYSYIYSTMSLRDFSVRLSHTPGEQSMVILEATVSIYLHTYVYIGAYMRVMYCIICPILLYSNANSTYTILHIYTILNLY